MGVNPDKVEASRKGASNVVRHGVDTLHVLEFVVAYYGRWLSHGEVVQK